MPSGAWPAVTTMSPPGRPVRDGVGEQIIQDAREPEGVVQANEPGHVGGDVDLVGGAGWLMLRRSAPREGHQVGGPALQG